MRLRDRIWPDNWAQSALFSYVFAGMAVGSWLFAVERVPKPEGTVLLAALAAVFAISAIWQWRAEKRTDQSNDLDRR